MKRNDDDFLELAKENIYALAKLIEKDKEKEERSDRIATAIGVAIAGFAVGIFVASMIFT